MRSQSSVEILAQRSFNVLDPTAPAGLRVGSAQALLGARLCVLVHRVDPLAFFNRRALRDVWALRRAFFGPSAEDFGGFEERWRKWPQRT